MLRIIEFVKSKKLFLAGILFVAAVVLYLAFASAQWTSGMNQNLTAYWNFSDTFTDDSGNVRTLTNQSGAWVTGKVGNARSMAVNTKMTTPETNFTFYGNNFTINIWLNLTSYTANQDIISTLTLEGAGWWLVIYGSVFYWVQDYYELVRTCNEMPAANQWSMITIRRAGTNFSMWKNGTTCNSTTAMDIGLGDGTMIIGAGQFHHTWSANSIVEEISISNGYAWNDTEIAAAYNSGAGTTHTTYFPPADTCSCPSVNTNWQIDMSDYCNITSNCNLGTGRLNFTGAGYCNVSAIINTTGMGMPSNNSILYIATAGRINIK